MSEALTWTSRTGKVYLPNGKVFANEDEYQRYLDGKNIPSEPITSEGLLAPKVEMVEIGVEQQERATNLRNALTRIYGDQDLNQVVNFINTEPKIFHQQMKEYGRAPETESLIKGLGLSETQTDYFWMSEGEKREFEGDLLRQGRTPGTEKIMRDLQPDITDDEIDIFYKQGEVKAEVERHRVTMGPAEKGLPTRAEVEAEKEAVESKKSLWNTFYFAMQQGIHSTGQLYNYIRKSLPISPYLSPEEKEGFQQSRQNFAQKYTSNKAEFDEWVKKHPENQPPADVIALKESIGKLSFDRQLEMYIKNPKAMAYTIAETAPPTLAAMASFTAATALTGNPYVGMAASYFTLAPMQIEDVAQDLINSGVPEDKAYQIAIPVGGFINALDIVGDIPLMRALSPILKGLTGGLQKELINKTMAQMVKRGVTTFTVSEFTETFTEVAQQVTQDYTVSFFDKNRNPFENINSTIVQTLIATSPFALFGGASSFIHVNKPQALATTNKEGWYKDEHTGEWYRPQRLVEVFKEKLKEFQDAGLGLEQANVKALNFIAQTKEGAQKIGEMVQRLGAELATSEVGAIGGGVRGLKELSTLKETNLYKDLQGKALKAGLDLEAIEGIAPGEYFVTLSANKEGAGDFLKWESLVTKTNQDLNKIAKDVGERLYELRQGELKPKYTKIAGTKTGQSFIPFQSLEQVQKFLETGDTSLIAKQINLKGKPWAPEHLRETEEAIQKTNAKLVVIDNQIREKRNLIDSKKAELVVTKLPQTFKRLNKEINQLEVEITALNNQKIKAEPAGMIGERLRAKKPQVKHGTGKVVPQKIFDEEGNVIFESTIQPEKVIGKAKEVVKPTEPAPAKAINVTVNQMIDYIKSYRKVNKGTMPELSDWIDRQRSHGKSTNFHFLKRWEELWPEAIKIEAEVALPQAKSIVPAKAEIPKAPVLPEIEAEMPTGRYSVFMRNIGDIVSDEKNFLKIDKETGELAGLKSKAKIQFVTDIIEAVDNKVIAKNEAGSLLEEYINHPLLDKGDYEGFIDYWRGRPKTMIEAKPSKPMTENEINAFFESQKAKAPEVAPKAEAPQAVVPKVEAEQPPVEVSETPVSPPVAPQPAAPPPGTKPPVAEGVVPPVVPPEKPVATATPEPLPEPTDIQRVKDLHSDISLDVKAIRASLGASNTLENVARRNMLYGADRLIKQADGILDQVQRGIEVSADEIGALADKLQSIKDFYNMKLDVKERLANYVKANLSKEEQGNFITAIKNIKDPAELTEIMAKIDQIAERTEIKTLTAKIHKLLAKAKPKVVEGIKKGKFGAEAQDYLDVIRTPTTTTMDELVNQVSDLMQKLQDNKIDQTDFDNKMGILNLQRLAVIVSDAKHRTIDELNEVLIDIKSIMDIGRTERQNLRIKQAEKTAANVEAVIDVATGGKGFKPGTGVLDSRELQANQTFVSKLTDNWKAWHNLLDKISKFKKGEPYQSAISNIGKLVDKAGLAEQTGLRKYQEDIINNFAVIYGIKINNKSAINAKLNQLEKEKVDLGTFRVTTEKGTELVHMVKTKNAIIQHYLWLQDPTLEPTYQEGMHYTYEINTAIVNALSPKDIAFADYIFEFYRNYYPTIDPVYGEIYGIHLPNNSMYSGALQRDFEAGVPENVMMFKDLAHYASTKNGSLMTRTKNILLLHDTSVLANLFHHVEQMEHFKAWALPMRDLRSVFMNKDVRTAIQQYHGPDMMNKIDNYLNNFARGGIDRAHVNRTLDWLRGNFSTAVLGLKPKIAVQQIPTMLGFMTEMPTGDFFTGVGDFMSHPIETYKWMMEHSTYIRERYSGGNWERDIRQAVSKKQFANWSGKASFTEKMYFLIESGDKLGVMPGWWAKYQSALKYGKTEAEAQLEANLSSDRTQNSSTIESLSTWQNGGSFMKLMTMFQNQPNKYFNIMADNMRNFQYGRGSRPKAVANILMVSVVLPALYNIIATAFRLRDAEDLKEAAIITAMSPINNMLVIGSLAQSIYGWIADEPFQYRVSPVLDTIDELKYAISNAKKMINAGQDPYKDVSSDDVVTLVEHLAMAGGQVLGLPTPYLVQVERAIRGGKPWELIYSRWVLEHDKPGVHEKIEEATAKIGQSIEYTEKQLNAMAKAGLTIPAKVTDMKKYIAEVRQDIGHVLPTEITQKNGYSPQGEFVGKYIISEQKAGVIPNIRLKDYFNDDYDDFSPRQYQQQYLASLRIDSLEQLKAFTSPGQFPKYYLGNLTPAQLSLLDQYAVLDKEGKKKFEKEHPEMNQVPRDDWLIKNPEDNARLAIGGYLGKDGILTQESYDMAVKMVKELDIPDNAVEQYLPPKETVKAYFERQDMLKGLEEKGIQAVGSWEDDLLLAKNLELRMYLGYAPVKTNRQALELKVKNADNLRLWESYTDKTKDDVIKDKDGLTELDRARRDLKAVKVGKETFGDILRRLDAWKQIPDEEASEDYSKSLVEKTVERGKLFGDLPSQSSPNGFKAKAWLLDNEDWWRWAVGNKLYGDTKKGEETDETDWQALKKKEPTIRLDVQWESKDKWYNDEIPKRVPLNLSGKDKDKWIREERATYEKLNPDWHVSVITRDAYQKEVPNNFLPEYVEYYSKLDTENKQRRYRLEHPDFDKNVLTNEKVMDKALLPVDPSDVRPAGYDNIHDRWKAELDEYNEGILEKYSGVVDSEKRAAAIKKDRDDLLKRTPNQVIDGVEYNFTRDRLRYQAYDEKLSEISIDDYVNYEMLPLKGWARERYLLANERFYKEAKEKLPLKTELQAVKIPSEEVEKKYFHYHDVLPSRTNARKVYLEQPENIDLAWFMLLKGEITKMPETQTPAVKAGSALENLYQQWRISSKSEQDALLANHPELKRYIEQEKQGVRVKAVQKTIADLLAGQKRDKTLVGVK